MRLFIAIDIDDEEVCYKAYTIQRLLVDSGVIGTYPSRDQLHITLKFLGETPEYKLSSINASLSKISVDGEVLLRISGVGAFPSLKRPRVVFLDVDGNDKLYSLQSTIEKEMVKLGFRKEDRPFKPHITIYRVKRPWTWKDSLSRELSSIDIGKTLSINEFKLKESVLTSSGPIYKDIYVYSLGGR